MRSNHVQWLGQRSSRNNGDESGLLGNWCLNSLLLLQLVLYVNRFIAVLVQED